MGWLDDDQTHCHDGSGDVVVESRRKIGVDQHMSKEGALVYVIDTKLGSGQGPIQVKPGVDKGNALMEDAPMPEGDTYPFRNVMVEVLESRLDGDRIRVHLTER